MINNTPEIKLGIVAVSRDCFPNSLSENRRKAVVKAYDGEIYECPIIVENEIDMMNALEDLKKAECDALVVYLGNFGPETEETLLVKYFDGPCMVVAAAEETGDDLVGGRGDAYCGVLNASYNLKLRNLHAYIPEYPVGDAEDVAAMIKDFVPVATAVVAVKNLKIISFGPRPTNFLACNAPIKQLYNLGVEIEENSELDLFEAFNKHETPKNIINMYALQMWGEFGGSGVTIGLVIAIMIFGKREDNKAIATLSLVPGLFNINETVTFGIPMVLNPILGIPFVVAPLITIIIGYVLTVIGFCPVACLTVPWTTPPIVFGFLACGASIMGAVTQAILIVVSTVIYTPFLISYEKYQNKQAAEA